MAYSELIKNFARIRDYMREFYVYGFKSRGEYDAKSSRSYDNERRRVESWLGEYLSFRRDASGKNVFLSVDSRHIPRNPLHKAFKAKSFTDTDITLHFYLMDILADGGALSTRAIVEQMNDGYLARVAHPISPDESTVRKKLKEYEKLGLIRSEKQGREVLYRRTDDRMPDLASWREALGFYTEADPMGVIGSYLTDRLEQPSDTFRFKHHYMLHALDSEVLYRLLLAIDERRAVELALRSHRTGRDYVRTVCPLKIYVSTQTGRQYLLGYHYAGRHMAFHRLDAILAVTPGGVEEAYDQYAGWQVKFDENLWGVSTGTECGLDRVEMTVFHGPNEGYILQRLEREKRHGRVERLDDHTSRLVADVYDASEMLPWLRTFIGRIVEFRCSNRYVETVFYEDLARMNELYGGDGNAVQ